MGSDQRHNSLEITAEECDRAEKMLCHHEHQEMSSGKQTKERIKKKRTSRVVIPFE